MKSKWPPHKNSSSDLQFVLKELASGKLVAADFFLCLILLPLIPVTFLHPLKLWIITILAAYFTFCCILFWISNELFKRKKT
ncbi:hypothetical protein WQ57_13160 [Mesobacillus campisalis]|uniref:Uncharacterized protein n=1 Tax=Mesobacillus campisalis TaxID=1408103 RepID=A0A0M2SYI3_9BACI|nr:hypothetical protein WQ57_13160 [Mesobacillus campisalis]